MSKFGSTAIFYYDAESDSITGTTSISLSEQDMPQYPMDEGRKTDERNFTTLSGVEYITRNYNKRTFVFNWTDLRESKRDELATMADSLPILSFRSGGFDWGTFRMETNSFNSAETSFELYDVSFSVVEDQ